MNNILTNSIQDYLKTIYSLTSDDKEASTTTLATRLGVAPASVTGMLQKLASLNPPLVIYQKHHGATLTKTGEKAALEVIRHHRLLEAYLVESLGYSWDSVHKEACQLEHVISEDFEARIAESLGHPDRDPHGAPIPSADLIMPPTDDVLLSSLHSGDKAIVQRVRCEDVGLLHQLEGLGLVPGAELTVLAYPSSGENLTVGISGHSPSIIGLSVSSQVFVEIMEET